MFSLLRFLLKLYGGPKLDIAKSWRKPKVDFFQILKLTFFKHLQINTCSHYSIWESKLYIITAGIFSNNFMEIYLYSMYFYRTQLTLAEIGVHAPHPSISCSTSTHWIPLHFQSVGSASRYNTPYVASNIWKTHREWHRIFSESLSFGNLQWGAFWSSESYSWCWRKTADVWWPSKQGEYCLPKSVTLWLQGLLEDV